MLTMHFFKFFSLYTLMTLNDAFANRLQLQAIEFPFLLKVKEREGKLLPRIPHQVIS